MKYKVNLVRRMAFRRRFRMFLAKGFVYVTKTRNNTFVTLTTRKGDVILKESGGCIKTKGPKKKNSGNSAERASFRLGKEAVLRGYNQCYLRIHGQYFGPIKNALSGLHRAQVRFTKLQQIKQEAHNGVRRRKSKRK